MAFKEATDCCAGTSVIYGAPDLVKVMQFLNGKAITGCCPVLVRDTIFSLSCPCDTSKRMRFNIPSGIAGCTTIVGTIPSTVSFTFVDLITTQVLTGKTIAFGSNTLTGVASLTTCQTLTCKTMDADCNTFTNLAIGAEVVTTLTETQEIWIGAEAMKGMCIVTCGAGFAERELPTNDVYWSTQNFDTCTQEFAQFWWTPPANWNAGTVRFKAMWTAQSGCGTFISALEARAYADSDAIDQAWCGAQTSTDTLLTANDIHISPYSAAITIQGTPVAGEPVAFRLKRIVACDTLGVDAEVKGITIEYSINDIGTT